MAAACTVTVTGFDRPPFVSTTTGTWALTPAGTTTLSSVSLASATCAFVLPKRTVFPAAVAAKCSPARVTDWPVSTVSGVTEATSGGVPRRKKNHTSAATAARAPAPPRIGTTGMDGSAKERRRFAGARPLPFPPAGRAAGLAAGRRGGNSDLWAGSAGWSATGIDGSSVW